MPETKEFNNLPEFALLAKKKWSKVARLKTTTHATFGRQSTQPTLTHLRQLCVSLIRRGISDCIFRAVDRAKAELSAGRVRGSALRPSLCVGSGGGRCRGGVSVELAVRIRLPQSRRRSGLHFRAAARNVRNARMNTTNRLIT